MHIGEWDLARTYQTQLSERTLSVLWPDLEQLLDDLGGQGGLMSPSVYDTAQCLRFNPPKDPIPALNWLIEQQEADGGWCTVAAPRARYMPTLAAILALHTFLPHEARAQMAIHAGLRFISDRQNHDWQELGDDLPGGAELILPRLLNEAKAAGLAIDERPYQALIALGERRRRLIQKLPRLEGTTATHVWEGWGSYPHAHLVDGSKTVGHSPAASAAWLAAARNEPELAKLCAIVQEGLEEAEAATTSPYPGVICSCWPMGHFERAFSLYPLFLAGLLNPENVPLSFAPQIERQLDLLQAAMSSEGLGFTPWFLADGDDTSVAMAMLSALGRKVDLAALYRFRSSDGDHFCAWQGELQPSPTVTAHAIQALALQPKVDQGELAVYCNYILERQQGPGLWAGEKWNASYIYTTTQVLIALLEADWHDELGMIIEGLEAVQHPNGGWGMQHTSAEETAYVVLALLYAQRRGFILAANAVGMLTRAHRWLRQNYRPFAEDGIPVWLGKETYRPLRISRAFEVAALIALEKEFASGEYVV